MGGSAGIGEIRGGFAAFDMSAMRRLVLRREAVRCILNVIHEYGERRDA